MKLMQQVKRERIHILLILLVWIFAVSAALFNDVNKFVSLVIPYADKVGFIFAGVTVFIGFVSNKLKIRSDISVIPDEKRRKVIRTIARDKERKLYHLVFFQLAYTVITFFIYSIHKSGYAAENFERVSVIALLFVMASTLSFMINLYFLHEDLSDLSDEIDERKEIEAKRKALLIKLNELEKNATPLSDRQSELLRQYTRAISR